MTPPPAGLAAALARLARSRDATAWEVVVDQAGGAIGRLARRVTGDPDLAADALQETLLQIRDHAGRAPPEHEPDADQRALRWTLRVATNVCLQLLRRQHRARARDQRAGAALPQATDGEQAAALAGAEEVALLRRELAGLPEGVRYAIVSRHLAGLPFADIAVDLGIPEATARVHVHRGLLRLRDRLARLGVVCSVGVLTATFAQLSAAEPALAAAACLPPAAATALLTSAKASTVATYSAWSLAMPLKLALAGAIAAALAASPLVFAAQAPPPPAASADLSANLLIFPQPAKGLPARGERGPGTRIVLWPQVDKGDADYAIGIAHLTMWQSLPIANAAHSFRFIAGDSEVMRVQGDGSVGVGGATPAPGAALAVKDGHLQVQQAVEPLVASGSAAGQGARVVLANATDSAGRLEVTLGTAPTAGALARVVFAKPYATPPIVTLTPANAAAAKAACFVTATTTAFEIAGADAGVDGVTYQFMYQVIETQ
jgi:RNA polymerase sigma-70 factor (ECF subfamily)